MAKTVDNFSTIENFRTRYNELATDVGDIAGLRSSIGGATLVDALNTLEDKSFFFQEFIFNATASQTTFSGNDEFDNELRFKRNRIQVFKNGNHLLEDDDYIIGGPSGSFHTSIILNSGASLNDKIVIYAYTGSFEGTAASSNIVGYFSESTLNTIYNTNDNGIILNGDNSTPTTQLQSGYTIQLAGKSYAEDDITLASGKTLNAPIITDGTAQITGGVGTSFSSITSTNFVGNLTGNITSTGTSTFSNIDVNGGAIDGAVIGANSAAAITGTTITASTNFSGNLTGNVTGNVTGTVSSLSNHDTDDVAEGSTNQYFTNARADARIAAASIEDLSDVHTLGTPTAGQILAWNASNNRFEIADNATVSGSITETTNKYFTDARVNDVISAGSGLAKSYNAGTSDPLDGVATLSVNTSNGIKIDGDDVELDYETTSTTPTSVGSTATGHLWFVI
jgi:hypothetical protein